MKKIILLSGGLDSATLLAHQADENTLALFFNYNQKALSSEIKAVNKIAQTYNVPILYRDITEAFKESACTLLKTSSEFPGHGSTELEFRNGVFLSHAISLALQLFPAEEVEIMLGLIKLHVSYSDCSFKFLDLYNNIAQLCSNNKITISAPFIEKGKDEVLAIAKQTGLNIQETWSCYTEAEKPCGMCDACIDRITLGVL